MVKTLHHRTCYRGAAKQGLMQSNNYFDSIQLLRVVFRFSWNYKTGTAREHPDFLSYTASSESETRSGLTFSKRRRYNCVVLLCPVAAMFCEGSKP